MKSMRHMRIQVLIRGKVTVMASGMGMPSTKGILFYELFSVYDVDQMEMHVGSANMYQELNLGDVVLEEECMVSLLFMPEQLR